MNQPNEPNSAPRRSHNNTNLFNKTQNYQNNPAFEFTDLDPSNQVSEIDEAYEDAEEISDARYSTIQGI